VDYGHIHFCLDTVHASGYNAQTIPAQNQNDTPMWDIMPETTQIDFTGYILSGTFHSPHLMVWSIDSYGQVSESAKTNIDDLKQILQEKRVDPERVPFLPLWNAAQMFVAKPQYLRFQNGNGIRFLSMYGQAAYPVAGDKLIYIYQGISDDNTQYISVVLPVTNPNIPPDQSTDPNFDWTTFSESFPEYLTDIKAQLNGWSDDSYSPNLTDLDLFINSIQLIP
jgi:hypothetical protein